MSSRRPDTAQEMTFAEFLSAVEEQLSRVKAKLLQRQESDSNGLVWWFSFTRAACLYRISFNRQTHMLALEKGQGSFVPNSEPTWRTLESKAQTETSLEISLELISAFLGRFPQ